jgi:PIN domain nuclease of toxin-antitoxin system
MMSKKNLLLDTHIWLNYQGFTKALRRSTEQAIDEAAERNAVYISVISIWEIAMLVRAARLELNTSIDRWAEIALSKPGITLLPFSPLIAIESVNLPEPMHKDPSDRILVASARVEQMTLVTSDEKILTFAKTTGLPYLRG